jgi:DNA-binding NarL/FixJ family response regulator
MERIRVVIADDHPVFREGLLRVFEGVESLSCIATAQDGEEAVRLAQELNPDVIILDINMPKITGIDAAKLIKENCHKTAVLMLSAYKYDHYIVSSIRAGVDGYLLKNAPHDELINAIHTVHAGGGAFSAEACGKIMHKIAGGKGWVNVSYPGLGNRELEVLSLVAKGMSNKQISNSLNISENTVAAHMANIFRKIGVESRTEAILSAMKMGLINIDDMTGEQET